jgi:hypothetical protein
MLTSCAVAFAIFGAQSHDYLNVAAAMVIIFWMGTALAFVGLVLDRHGDLWFAPASLAESIGLGTIVIALFTGAYYGAMFILATVTMTVFS